MRPNSATLNQVNGLMVEDYPGLCLHKRSRNSTRARKSRLFAEVPQHRQAEAHLARSQAFALFLE